MTPDEQRIAIAEFCGWKIVQAPASAWESYSSPPAKTGWMDKSWDSPIGLPDYLNDLNAMHEAVEHLSEEEQYVYSQHLIMAVGLDPAMELMGLDLFNIAYATAAQRAEALLRTVGKWV